MTLRTTVSKTSGACEIYESGGNGVDNKTL